MSADGTRGTETPLEHTPGQSARETLPALFGFLSLWRCEVFFSSSLLDADAFWIRTSTAAGVTQDFLLGKKNRT